MQRNAVLAVVMLLVGCEPPIETTTQPNIPVPRPQPTDTEDSGTEPERLGPLDPTAFELQAYFAFDNEFGEFSNYAIPDQGIVPMSFQVVFLDEIRDVGCAVAFQFDRNARPMPAEWTDDQNAWVAVDVPSDATVVDGCAPYQFPLEWGGESPANALAQFEWGFGILPIDNQLSEQLERSLDPNFWAAVSPFWIGSVFYSDALIGSNLAPEGYVDLGLAIGYELDGNFQIDTDGTGNSLPILNDRINTQQGVTTGYYEAWLRISPASILTPAP